MSYGHEVEAIAAETSPAVEAKRRERSVRDRAAADLADLALIGEVLIAVGRSGGRMDRVQSMFTPDVERLRATLGMVLATSDTPTGDAWASLNDAHSEIGDLSKRLMAYVGGSLLRDEIEGAQTRASNAFAIALALTDELSDATQIGWEKDILPADHEYTATDTGLIHMVFPRLTVWDLPAVMHEFGHYAALRITNGSVVPFKVIRDSGSLGAPDHIEELFADAFASYVGGPAFGCACAMQRFSPTDAEAVEDTKTHPSHAARIHMIVALLRGRSTEVGDPEWDQVTSLIEQCWASNLAAIGKPTELPDAWQPKLDLEVLRRIRDQVLAQVATARYQSWGSAVALAAQLDPDREMAIAAVPRGTSLRDILNSGWVARLWWPDDVARIERSVRGLLTQVVTARVQAKRGRL